MKATVVKTLGRTTLFLFLLFWFVLGVFSFTRQIQHTVPKVGVEWVESDRGPVALEVAPGGPGDIAGLEPGDRLVQVGDITVDGQIVAEDAIWTSEGGTWTIERQGSFFQVDVIADRQPAYGPYGFLCVVGLAFWLSAVFIEWRGSKVRGGRLYVWLALTFFVHLVYSHTGRADFWDWIIYAADVLAGAFIPPLLMHFAAVQSRKLPDRAKGLLALIYSPALLLVMFGFWASPGGLGGAYLFDDPIALENLRERIEPLWLSIAVIVAGYWLAVGALQFSSATFRSQARWLLTGLLVGLLPYITLSAIPFAFGAGSQAPWIAFLAVLPMIFMPAIFTAALARYRLFDMNTWMRWIVVESTAILFTFGVYALAREIASNLLGTGASAARYLGLFSAFLSYAPIRGAVRHGVERALYRDRYSYRATLLDWSRELNAEPELRALVQRVERRVEETLDVPRARVWLYREDRRFEWLDEQGASSETHWPEDGGELPLEGGPRRLSHGLDDQGGAAWAFPMRVSNELCAVLMVAERTAPAPPLSSEDRALLGTLAEHAASAIQSARRLRAVRRHAEQIEALHSRQEKILDSSAVGLALANVDGEVLAWNRALSEIYGLPASQAVGRPLREVFPAALLRRIRRARATSNPEEETRLYRYALIDRRGQRIIVNLTVTPAGGPTARDDAWVLTFDDVSERVKMEQQLLRQERLASLGMLAAGVAHEVNTPLTGISSYTQMLLEELPVGDPRRKTLEKIDTQTKRATDIVKSLLNLSRVEQASLGPLSINELIREVLQLFEPQVKGRGIHIEVSLDRSVPEVHGHRGKLQQVLLNLLINARDAVDSEGTIQISTRYRDGHVILEILDDGMGIAEEDLPRVFDPFFTTKVRGKGTGLGLSISYGLIQEHDGEIHVESEPGEYTRFRIELPAATMAAAMA